MGVLIAAVCILVEVGMVGRDDGAERSTSSKSCQDALFADAATELDVDAAAAGASRDSYTLK